MKRLSLLLPLLMLLAACVPGVRPATSAAPARTLTSAPAAMQIDILKGWAFKPDPSGKADWSAPSLDDSSWDVIDAGDFWQKQGYDGYAGVAWYRKAVSIPSTWAGRQAYLVAGGVNDQYQVYVDGKQQGQAGPLSPSESAILHPTLTPLQLAAGRTNLIAIKVESAHNFGGLAKAPLMLTTQPQVPASLEDQARTYAQAHPDGVWPGWMRAQGRSWTVVGLPQGGPETLIGRDGSWEATSTAPAVSAWLVDAGQVRGPAGAESSLMDGDLPLVRTTWKDGDVQVSGLLWQEPGSAEWQLHVHNGGAARSLALYVALRPYQVQPGVAPLFDVGVQGQMVMANGRPALLAAQTPSRVVASTGAQGDVSVTPSAIYQAASDGAGLASIALVYDLQPGAGADQTFNFAAPTGAAPARLVTDSSAAAGRWKSILQPGSISLPDQRVTDAYDASLAYILMSNDGGALHPGPLLHDAFWYRDTSYMLAALERNGNLAQVRSLLAALTRFQTPDGEFPANVSTHTEVGHPRGAPEWDSQGEGIHALVDYWRFSHDQDWLTANWPAIDRAARWLERLAGADGSGLLPPGESAEDLGPADQRHFWDDFWGVIGFRDASAAASAAGQVERAQQLTAEGDALLQATLAAGQPGLQREGIFPNGPDSRETPADARGTSPAVWPGQLLPSAMASQLFAGYYARFVQPYKGAFRHEDNNFWPFGGLEIAHGALYAGLPAPAQTILEWTLDHPTFPGVWAWGDEVNQDGSNLLGGDMPHGWTAAEYVDLVRDMLLYEFGDTLQVAAGVPASWLPDGQTVSVSKMATYFGAVSYQLRRSGPKVTLDIQASTPPPGGYDLRLPFQVAELAVDGGPFAAPAGANMHLPPGTKHVELELAGG